MVDSDKETQVTILFFAYLREVVGMKVLKKTPRPGLQKLLAKMNIDQHEV